MLHVLLICPEWPPALGGAGVMGRGLMRALRARGRVRVTALVGGRGGAGAIGVGGTNGGPHRWWSLVLFCVRAFWAARRICRHQKVDVVQAISGLPSGLVAAMLGRPFVVSLVGSDVPGHNPCYRLFDRLISGWLSPFVWRRAAHVVANSPTLLTLARRACPAGANISCIAGGVNLPRLAEKKRPSKHLRIGFVGRLARVKNLPLLLRACARLGGNWRLKIVGEGPERDYLERLASELGIQKRVHFLGARNAAGVQRELEKMDVFVLPSLAEGMSNAALEAAAAGLPLLLGPVGGADQLVAEGKNGFFISVTDESDLARRLEYFQFNTKIIQKMGARSRQTAKEFSWERAAKHYERCLIAAAKQGNS